MMMMINALHQMIVNIQMIKKEQYYAFVVSFNFENYKQEEGDKSSVYLINCGLLCNNTEFIDCVTNSGGEGAIFNATFH